MKHNAYVHYCSTLPILFVAHICQTWNAPIVAVETAVKLFAQTWYPNETDFNESCLIEGCPGLNNLSLCPAEVDENKLNDLLDIMSGCMRGPICGITIDERPTVHVTVPLDGFLPDKSIKGFVTTIPDAGHLSNVSNIELELLPGQTGRLPLQMTFHTPKMRSHGQVDVQIVFPEEWSPDNGQPLEIRLPNVTYEAPYQFFCTIFLNQSSNSSRIEIDFRVPIIKASYEYCGLDMPVGLPNIVQLLTQVSNELMEKSELATVKARFFKRVFQGAIDVVSKNCSD